MYFQYGGNSGAEAYRKAVENGTFSYVILNGGMGEEARQMDGAIRPALGSYQLQMSAIEPRLGHTIEIYARRNAAPVPDNVPNVSIVSPASNSVVNSKDAAVLVEGLTNGAQAGWTAQVEVFTDQWYAADKAVPIQADGKFFQTIYLGGEGKQQCSHLLRARLFDQDGKSRAVTLNYGITRANQDGSLPNCR
jgi:hypothetical protein